MSIKEFTHANPIITPEGLESRFTQPDGFQFAALATKRGDLRLGMAAPPFAPRGVVVILPGLSEFIEKYYETTRNLLQQNFAVVIIEWSGNGLSPRALPNQPHKRHITSLEPDADDLTALLQSPLMRSFGCPVHVLAHSMGGLIFLTAATRKQPLPVSSAVLTSPLLGLPQFSGLSGVFFRPLLTTLRLAAPSAYIPGGHDWTGAEREPAGSGIFSSDAARDSLQNSWFRANPALQIGSPTNGWVAAVLEASQRLHDPDTLRQLSCPTLVLQAGNDQLVHNASANVLLDSQMVKIDTIGGAKHEILMERDDMRNAALNAFFAWIDRAASLQVMNEFVADSAGQCGCRGCGCQPR